MPRALADAVADGVHADKRNDDPVRPHFRRCSGWLTDTERARRKDAAAQPEEHRRFAAFKPGKGDRLVRRGIVGYASRTDPALHRVIDGPAAGSEHRPHPANGGSLPPRALSRVNRSERTRLGRDGAATFCTWWAPVN